MKLITLIFLFLIAMVRPVYAYMDPGSLTILLQVIISGIVGTIIYIKMFSKKIKEYLTKIFIKIKNKKKKS